MHKANRDMNGLPQPMEPNLFAFGNDPGDVHIAPGRGAAP